MEEIVVKEVSLEEAVKIGLTIKEFDGDYSREHYTEKMKEKESLIIAAFIEGNPAGFMVGYNRDNDNSFYCWMAGTTPEYRKKGVPTKLMKYLEKWAKEKGYKKIKLKTRNHRRAMLYFMVKNGFNFTEIEKMEKAEDNRIFTEKKL